MLFSSFDDAVKYLGGKTDRPAPKSMGSPRATRIVLLDKEDGKPTKIGLRYQQTNVVVYTPEGMSLHTGGWLTVTTKRRMNEAAPPHVNIYSDKGIWYVSVFRSFIEGAPVRDIYEFEDGLTLSYDGKILGEAKLYDPESLKKLAALKRKVTKYVEGFMDALEAGQFMGKTMEGDCWACLLLLQTGEPVLGNDHILQHFDDPDGPYYVLSLLLAAMKTMPVSMTMEWWVQSLVVEEAQRSVWNERERVAKILKRFILRQLGKGG